MWPIHLSFLHATWKFNSPTARSLMPIVAKFLLQSFQPVVNDPWIGKLQKASISSLTSWILKELVLGSHDFLILDIPNFSHFVHLDNALSCE
jgi:hypothetical protein